jgi:hypothetical protein
MRAVPLKIKRLRETAERCYRLARATTDVDVKAILTEMGKEADKEIARLEAKQIPAVDMQYP